MTRYDLLSVNVGASSMNLLLCRTLVAVSMVILLYAVIHGILTSEPSALVYPRIHIAYLCLLGAGYFICRQREIDWCKRPEKLRKLRSAKKLLLVGFAAAVVLLGADLYEPFLGTSLGT